MGRRWRSQGPCSTRAFPCRARSCRSHPRAVQGPTARSWRPPPVLCGFPASPRPRGPHGNVTSRPRGRRHRPIRPAVRSASPVRLRWAEASPHSSSERLTVRPAPARGRGARGLPLPAQGLRRGRPSRAESPSGQGQPTAPTSAGLDRRARDATRYSPPGPLRYCSPRRPRHDDERHARRHGLHLEKMSTPRACRLSRNATPCASRPMAPSRATPPCAVPAISRVAAVAPFAPLPPGVDLKLDPRIISSGAGMWGQRAIRSMLAEPTTRMAGGRTPGKGVTSRRSMEPPYSLTSSLDSVTWKGDFPHKDKVHLSCCGCIRTPRCEFQLVEEITEDRVAVNIPDLPHQMTIRVMTPGLVRG